MLCQIFITEVTEKLCPDELRVYFQMYFCVTMYLNKQKHYHHHICYSTFGCLNLSATLMLYCTFYQCTFKECLLFLEIFSCAVLV